MHWIEAATGVDRKTIHNTGPREFESIEGHWFRIQITRRWLHKLIGQLWRPEDLPKICELGCATLDIGGPFTLDGYPVFGYEFNEPSATRAKKKFPLATVRLGDIEAMEVPHQDTIGGVLVMCEILEHILHPKELVAKFMPNFRAAIISHPINEQYLTGPGPQAIEHCWSFDDADAQAWFTDNKFKVLDSGQFMNGPYPTIITIGYKE